MLAEETARRHSALDWTVLDIATKPGHELAHIFHQIPRKKLDDNTGSDAPAREISDFLDMGIQCGGNEAQASEIPVLTEASMSLARTAG